jgi:hypothetical protein
MRTSGGTTAERLLIVPAAHTHLGRLSFQLEMYELFHRAPAARAGHIIGTSTVLFGVFMLTSLAPGPSDAVIVAAIVLGMAAYGAALDRAAGIATAAVGAVLAATAYATSRALDPRFGLAFVMGGCAVQTFSHLFEDVPPPLSGGDRFVPLRVWLRSVDLGIVLRAAMQTALLFYWLELWASFRILPLQVLHLMMRAGHRPALRRAVDARVADILGGRADGWQRVTTALEGAP